MHDNPVNQSFHHHRPRFPTSLYRLVQIKVLMQTPHWNPEALCPPGLFPQNENVPRRPPLIPDTIFKRSTTKFQSSSSSAKKDTKRWIRAVPEIGKYVREFNEVHKNDENMQYRWYFDTLEEKDIQAQLYRIVDDKAKEMLDGIYGMMTYRDAQLQFGALMENFVATIATHPSFDPLTQTVRLFGIRSIVDSKLSTKRRSIREKAKKKNSQKDAEESRRTLQDDEDKVPMNASISKIADLADVEPLASSTVPDLPQHDNIPIHEWTKKTTQETNGSSPGEVLQSHTTTDSKPATNRDISQQKNLGIPLPGCKKTRIGARKTHNTRGKTIKPSTVQKAASGNATVIRKNKKPKLTAESMEIISESTDRSFKGVVHSPSLVIESAEKEDPNTSSACKGAADYLSDSDEEIRALERLLALKRRKKQKNGVQN